MTHPKDIKISQREQFALSKNNYVQSWWLNIFELLLTVFGLWRFYQMTKREKTEHFEEEIEPIETSGCDN